METLMNDIWLNLQGYYDNIVALLPKLLLAAVAFTILFFIANQTKRTVNNRLSRRMDDPLLATFLGRMAKTIVLIIAILVVLQIIGLGAAAGGLLAGAGVGAFVIGFAFKDIGENLLAGIMLAFNRPFRIGDVVELDGEKGKVVTLNLRNSHIKSFDGRDIYIPNANVVKQPVVNYTIDGFQRYDFDIGLDYGSDVNKAIEITLGVLNSIPDILTEEKAPSVSVSTLGASTLNLTAYYWLDTFDKKVSSGNVKTQAVYQTLTALDKAGFYMPGDIVELKNYHQSHLRTETDYSKKKMV